MLYPISTLNTSRGGVRLCYIWQDQLLLMEPQGFYCLTSPGASAIKVIGRRLPETILEAEHLLRILTFLTHPGESLALQCDRPS